MGLGDMGGGVLLLSPSLKVLGIGTGGTFLWGDPPGLARGSVWSPFSLAASSFTGCRLSSSASSSFKASGKEVGVFSNMEVVTRLWGVLGEGRGLGVGDPVGVSTSTLRPEDVSVGSELCEMDTLSKKSSVSSVHA